MSEAELIKQCHDLQDQINNKNEALHDIVTYGHSKACLGPERCSCTVGKALAALTTLEPKGGR